MTDQDRGAYTPQTDAPLAFDARYSRGSGERPLPMTLIISGVVLVALIAALAFFYRNGIRGGGHAPRVVGATVADTKAPPSGQDAAQVPAANQVYQVEAAPPGEGRAPTTTTLAPEPEAVAPRPVAATPVDQANLRPAQPQMVVQTAAPPAPAAAPVTASIPAAPKPVKIVKAVVAPKIVAPKVVVAAKVVGTPKAAALKVEDAEIPTGAPVVQIGAFSSSALAQKGWSDDAKVIPASMSGKTRKVEMASVNGKTFYRAFVGGFSSKAAAESFCASLKAAGKGCMVK